MSEERLIRVCDKCLRASCWQGVFLCDEAQGAGVISKTILELELLDLEHSDFWKDEEEL